VAAALLASCSGSEKVSGGPQEIEAAVRDLQRAFAAEDTDRVCGLLSTAARRHVEAMGHGSEGPCYFDLYMLIEGVQKSPSWRQRVAREVSDIHIEDDRATATVQFEDGQTASLPFVYERDQWRVDALFGGIPAAQQKDHY
jgi:hypothetical protein